MRVSKNKPKPPTDKKAAPVKVSIRMPGTLKKKIPLAVIKDGYNFRQKSKWLEGVLAKFLARKEWQGALLSELVVKCDDHDVFSLSIGPLEELDAEIEEVVRTNKSLAASRSTVIRAAINRHLLGV